MEKAELGVGSIHAKNLGLLGKWKWCFLTEKDALWRAVIQEFYGDDGGLGADSIQIVGVYGATFLQTLNDLYSLCDLIGNTTLSFDVIDKWSWSYEASGTFKVKTLSNSIQNALLSCCDVGKHHIWNSWIPQKVNVCIWRASLDRLASRSNLVAREILDVQAVTKSFTGCLRFVMGLMEMEEQVGQCRPGCNEKYQGGRHILVDSTTWISARFTHGYAA
ncbi:hypothetical protein Tco_0900633 [Tanacetum coccineum]